MSKYYVDGYHVPDGVTSADDVIKWQKKLGVTADGIWGKNTQRAYERYVSGSSGQAQGFDRAAESERISAALREILRPSVDSAIERRQKANRKQRAEIDADAASRGMESSTYVTDVKTDADRDMEDDIEDYETEYGQVFASTLESMLTDAYKNWIAEKTAREQLELEKQKLAQSAEQFRQSMALEYKKLAQKNQNSQNNGESGGRTYSREDYLAFMNNLTMEQRQMLFTSESDYWRSVREQMVDDIGIDAFLEFEEAFREYAPIYRFPTEDDDRDDKDKDEEEFFGTV